MRPSATGSGSITVRIGRASLAAGHWLKAQRRRFRGTWHQMGPGHRTAVVAAPFVLTAGGFIVGTSTLLDRPWGALWSALAIGICCASVGVWWYGVTAWRELFPEEKPWQASVLEPIAVLLGLPFVGALVYAAVAWDGLSDEWRGLALCAIAILGALPTAGTMYGIRARAKDADRRPTAPPCGASSAARAFELNLLRRRSNGLARGLGILVTLTTLALGAAVKALDEPLDEVVVFGLAGSALVAACCFPVWAEIRRQGESLADALVDAAEDGDAGAPTSAGIGAVADLLSKRHSVEEALGVERTTLTELQAAIPVLGPLLATMALLLPR